jgi:hypothetical protein
MATAPSVYNAVFDTSLDTFNSNNNRGIAVTRRRKHPIVDVSFNGIQLVSFDATDFMLRARTLPEADMPQLIESLVRYAQLLARGPGTVELGARLLASEARNKELQSGWDAAAKRITELSNEVEFKDNRITTLLNDGRTQDEALKALQSSHGRGSVCPPSGRYGCIAASHRARVPLQRCRPTVRSLRRTRRGCRL